MSTPTRTPEKPWMSAREAATELGIGVRAVRRLADEGRLRHITTPGGHRRFRRSDVEAYLQAQLDGSTRAAS